MNYFLTIPKEINKNIDFRFSDDGLGIISSMYFNCSYYKGMTERANECVFIENASYQISLKINIANIYPDKEENFEIEFIVNNANNVVSLKKIFFLQKFHTIAEMLHKLIFLPFQVFGWYSDKDIEFILYENYNNYLAPLEKIDILIKTRNLNIKRTEINFMPQIGFIRKIMSFFKMLILFITFISSVLIQCSIYIVIIYFFRKEEVTEITNNNANDN